MITLIKGGTIVTSTDKFKADMLIKGERIAAIGLGLDQMADEVVDARGMLLLPGGIDAHTHFAITFMGAKTPGFDTAKAAAVGGTTTIVDFTPQPAGLSLVEAIYKHREEEAAGKAAVDYSLHSMIQDSSRESMYEELKGLVEVGVSTLKVFMAYKGTPFYCPDGVIFRLLQACKELGITIMTHCENADMVDILQRQLIAAGNTEPRYHAVSRPEAVEQEATQRAIQLAKTANAPLFVVHIACEEAMTTVRDANIGGMPVFGETCPHYLVLDVANLAKPEFEGAKYVCSPALRSKRHFQPLWESLQKGWLQTVGSDHAPFSFQKVKQAGKGDFTKIANGCPGIQDRLHILYTRGVRTGRLSINRLVDIYATAPAKFNGLYPRKGSLAVGADADVVVFDPKYQGTITVANSLEEIDYNSYEGMKQLGRCDKVFIRGQQVAKKGKYIAGEGFGQFIPSKPFGAAYGNL